MPLHGLRFYFEAQLYHYMELVFISALTTTQIIPNKKSPDHKIRAFLYHIYIRICSNRQRDRVRMILHARQRLLMG